MKLSKLTHEQLDDWPEEARRAMMEEAQWYEPGIVYKYGYYDGFKKAKSMIAAELYELRQSNTEYEILLELQHKRTIEADKLWQQAHNKPNTWPDLGELIGWLMSEIGKK